MSWHDAGSARSLGDARPWLPIEVAGVDIVLGAVDGEWYAVADACTHAGCAFSEDAQLIGAEIVCNCHGSEFDIRTGEVRRGPAERPVRAFAVRILGERFEVDV